MKKQEIDRITQDKIIYNYTVLGYGQKKAGKEFGFSDHMVKRILLENKIPIRSTQESHKKQYNMDENYFSRQGHNQAYIIGFLGADGNISSKDNRIDLELFPADYEILEKIRAELKLERPVKIYECASGYQKNKLYFYSAKIKQDLMQYGLVPNKTYSKDYHFPYKLDKAYIIDYIRGLFDGDGSVKKGTSLTFQIDSSSREIVEEIQKFFKEKYDIDTQITSTKKKNVILYRLYCYGENARKVYKILYVPNTLFLKRKFDKWNELM